MTTRTTAKLKAGLVSPDDLADRLATTLVVSTTKGKRKALATTTATTTTRATASFSDNLVEVEECRLSAMRSVNTGLQSLSTVIQSGWKKTTADTGEPSSSSSSKKNATLRNVQTASTSISMSLRKLRTLRPGDVDVERAALSFVGKLVTLEMFDAALLELIEMHDHLITMYHPDHPKKPPAKKKASAPKKLNPSDCLHSLSLPLPPSGTVEDPILSIVVSTYLLHTITCFAQYFISTRSSTTPTIASATTTLMKDAATIDLFAKALLGSPTFLAWISLLPTVPVKQKDSLLTSAYTILAKSTSSKSTPTASSIFNIRSYALSCLLHTSSDTVDPNTFWAQAAKFGAAFIESASTKTLKNDASRVLLSTFSDFVDIAEKRENREKFLQGKGFATFCEQWVKCARQADNPSLIGRITDLMQTASVTTTPPHVLATMTDGPGKGSSAITDSQTLENTAALGEGDLCAIFTRTTSFLEQVFTNQGMKINTSLTECVHEAISALRGSMNILFGEKPSDEQQRKSSKAARAFEKLRRTAIKVADVPQAQRSEASDAARLLLVSAAEALENVRTIKTDVDLLSQALDTLFLLARTALVSQDILTFSPAFDFLMRAVLLLGLGHCTDTWKAVGTDSHANFARCVSGAFYNLAGSLYQEGRYGAAVRFLKEACALGGWALNAHSNAGVSEGEEHWTVLEIQLYRRWELLAVCYMKNSDRQLAFDAFTQAIKTFPFAKTDFIHHTGLGGPNIVFNASTHLKQLGAIVEKLTYIGACDLFLDPVSVSLRAMMEGYPPGIIGMLLERQLEGLSKSLWKEGVSRVVSTLLVHAKEVYVTDEMPIRRARILLRCMDFAYHIGPENATTLGSLEEMGVELMKLLTIVDFVQDDTLAQFCLQYRASAHLWFALHAHRRMDEQQSTLVALHAEDACRDLKTALNSISGATVTPKAKEAATAKRIVPVKKRPRKSAAKGLFGNPVGEPVTPKPRKNLDSLDVSPPRRQDLKRPLVVFEDFEKLLSLLETTASLLGLLGLTFPRVSVLEMIRRICEQHGGALDNEYLVASAELALQFTKLGKVKRASTICNQGLSRTRNVNISAEVHVYFLLRRAEAVAMLDNVSQSSSIYCDAYSLSSGLPEDQGSSTSERVRARVGRLERAAIATQAFAMIQRAKNDLPSSLDGLLQSLRLWNRAVDSLARLRPVVPAAKPAETNPFDLTDLKDALPSDKPPSSQQGKSTRNKFAKPRFTSDNLELRTAQGLLDILFALSEAYIVRGSAREAEYFAEQAQEFALSMNAPAMGARALAWMGEVQLQQGRLQDGHQNLLQAKEMLKHTSNTDCADVQRLHGDYNQRCAQIMDAQCLYAEATQMLEELNNQFGALDSSVSRKSRSSQESVEEVLAPTLLATVLHQHIWLLRDDSSEHVKTLLDKFLSLPPSSQTKAEENALKARLTLHHVYERFRADIALSSLAESPITLPMGISGNKHFSSSPSTQEILNKLDSAEKLFWADLTCGKGTVPRVRDAALSLALIKALQTALGKSEGSSAQVVNLLDASTGITLRREMLETIKSKFPDVRTSDDLLWPLISQNGTILPVPKNQTSARRDRFLDSDDESEPTVEDTSLKEYWQSIQARYKSQVLDATRLSTRTADKLPKNWTVVNISVTEDRNTMFLTRQRAGTEPLTFCLPLKGRRESDEDEHLSFEDAMKELRTIVELSDEGTRQAINVKGNDMKARAAWWAERNTLDKRMRELLENIEFCWLGAFKTILSHPAHRPTDVISDLRSRLDSVFQNGLRSQEKMQKTRVRLDDNLLECFCALSPKCRDEELEDLVYFILDLYQFHGVGVAISEVDIDHVVVDLRSALEGHADQTKGKVVPEKDSHMFLVLDKNVQGIAWESIPILRGRSVSRVPSMDFLIDRLHMSKWQRERSGGRRGREHTAGMVDDRIPVDPRKTYYVLNPSGDLGRTEGRFVSWLKDMGKVGWNGIVGRPPSEQQFLDALSRKDLVIYFGHGGGEQYVRSYKIRNLKRCAATMLWGCSSGTLREMGDFERTGTPYNYMLAGCPCLVANIWDVTDRDIDKFAQSVFDKMHMAVPELQRWQERGNGSGISLVTAVAESRDSCKLKYLTGAAPVVYGIPFYL